ncbi:histidine kinase [Leifsonia sp. fls2-241-R2A-40a]|uniref:sensor histidine kinase n=1 Tax=Leifsonia sp. fls2-241-R2A-40a TaxID=3040290 RepID=UPI00254BB91D|nr:histidine kinase [Leifsonia sp. fls2-241-R2A-40a]
MTPEATPADAPGGLELPRPPGAIRRFLTAHPVAVDVFVAAVYLVPTLIGGLVIASWHPSIQETIHLVLSVVAGVALLARRQRPALVFAAATVLLGASVFLGRDMDVLPTLLALYALAVYRSIRSAWIAFGVTSAVTIVTLTVEVLLAQAKVFTPLQTAALPSGILVLSFSVVAVLIGSNTGNRRRYLDALIDRARQLARERDQQAEIAAAAERSRIAREMHDIVSHSLTVMITLADGSARVAEAEPEPAPARSVQAMRLVAETGRGALADMRRLLGVLHDGDGDTAARAPQPGVGDLADLVETFRAAGLPVRITVSGIPPEDVGQQLTVFRVVQEGLTNALRYAASSTAVRVVIVFQPGTVIITIDDDAALHAAPAPGSGRGLIGLRERVGLYGGALEAGPRPGGGWRVRAVFEAVRSPGTPATAAPQPPPASPSPTIPDTIEETP